VRHFLILTSLGLLLSGQTAFAGDRAQGETLVKQWCANCHVDDEAMRGTDAAPPLSTLAKENEHSPEWVRAWLIDPHPPMPNLNLSRQEIDDIQAYLRGLSEEQGEEKKDTNTENIDPRS